MGEVVRVMKIKRITDKKEFEVYGTWINGGTWTTQFFLYENGQWDWEEAKYFEPIQSNKN